VAEDYLWDRTGRDPEVERLERLLAPLRHDHRVPVHLPEVPRRRSPAVSTLWPAVAAAAGLLLAVAAVLRAPGPAGQAWEVARVEGAPVVGDDRLRGQGRLGVGQWLETDSVSRAQIQVGAIGEVQVEPRTRVRLVDAGALSHRLALGRGTLHARIWAPPRNFFVETTSGVAVDLGCAYTLEMDEAGSGSLRVTSGWVGFERQGRESIVPAGARCLIRRETGPGTPFFEDAPAAFREALARLDLAALAPSDRAAALDVVLTEARSLDAFTLWHLLVRVDGADRERVYDRLASLRPPPEGVTRDGVLAADPAMLDRWWNTLDLGTAQFWRQWKAGWFKDPRKLTPKR
jgi:hypothetical protein